MTRAVLETLLAHWRRHPVQLVTLLLGLSLATALWSGVQAINAEARASYDAAARAVGGDTLPALVDADGARIPLATYVALRRAGWLVTPVIEGELPARRGQVRLIGVDLLTAPPEAIAGEGATETEVEPADSLGAPGRIFANAETASRLDDDGLPPLVVAPNVPPGIVMADIGVAARALGRGPEVDRLLVLPDQPLGRPALADVAPELERREPGAQSDVARLTDSFHLNLTAFGLLSFAVGLFIVHGAVGLAFEQRRPTFRTLRALGLPSRRLLLLLGAELLAIALVAGAAGMALGGLIAAALLPDVAATLRGLYGADVDGALSLRPAWWAAGMAIAVAGTAVAGAGAMWKVATLPLLAPAQPRAWARASERTIRFQVAGAAALVALAVVLGIAGSGLVAGFLMLGALLVAAALLLPMWLSLCLRLGQRLARGPLAEWFWADTRQQLPGLGLALMALLLALAANIGVGTMVQSFRLTFTGWLDQRLAAELYLQVEDEAQGRDLTAWLEPRADAVLPIWNAETRVLGAPAEVFGVADHATYRENWPLLSALPDVWDAVATGDGVLVNEQLARREGLSPGDGIILSDWRTQVAGVYSDYGNPTGQVLVGLGELDQFEGVTRLNYGVRTDDPEGLADAIVNEFGLAPDRIVDQAALKRLSLDIFERTFAVTSALNVLTLGIAGVAILTSLLTLSGLRLSQLAPVWAVGLTRSRLGALELLRTLLLAALTFAAAIPVGLVLAWTLLAVINVDAFGWRLPMHVFPRDWLTLGLLSLAAAALASLWPTLRLARLRPAELVKVFAHER
jgi:putative ABC transport system permease protein